MSTNKLEKLIKDRINNFLGYGNLKSDIWFIGMEEGFDGKKEDLENMFKKTEDKLVVDLHHDVINPEKTVWLSSKNLIQPTWGKLIRILLTLKSDKGLFKGNNEEIKKFQREHFSRLDSDHCVLELMPLPCPSTKAKDWFYSEFEIDYLKTRKEYLEKIMPSRIKLFQTKIKEYHPKLVICYGTTYLEEWKKIMDLKEGELKKLEFNDKKKFFYIYYQHQNKENTHFFIIPHPVAVGMRNSYWDKIAQNIKQFKLNDFKNWIGFKECD